MSRKLGISDTAEIAVPAGASLAAVSVAGSAELLVTTGAAVVALRATGAAELGVLTGDQLTPPPSFVTPTLTAWAAMASAQVITSTVEFVAPTATDGTPCQVRFQLRLGVRDVETSPVYSTPEQNGPHAQTITVSNPLMRGFVCELWWAWKSGVYNVSWADTGHSVSVPAFGDPDNPQGS